MAIYHASTKPIARSAGRSAVAAAAYRAGAELVDHRTGLVHDYTRKGGVVSSDLIVPDGGAADRLALWNAAEQAEKRKDARTAREWIVALPSELDACQRRELALSFGAELTRRYGVAVDVCIHQPDRDGDNRNHHAHILTTTRQVSRDVGGELVMGNKASIELSDTKRRELKLGPAGDEVKAIRELWEQTANQALEQAGRTERIDARSLNAQGIDREATAHLGPVASEMERQGRASDRGAGNRQVAANNAKRKVLKAEIIDLQAERSRRIDPLRSYREAVEAEKPSTLDRAAAEGRLACASALVARGERLALHGPAIMEAGNKAAIEWAKDVQNAARPEPEPRIAKPEPTRVHQIDAADLVKQWNTEKEEMTRGYLVRAQRLEGRVWEQIEAIDTKRAKARQKHTEERPEEPSGLLGAFKRGAYDKALTAWQKTAKRIEAWKQDREASLRKRVDRVREFLKPNSWKLEKAVEAKLKRERPEWAARLPAAQAEVKQQRQAKTRERMARQKGRPDRDHGL